MSNKHIFVTGGAGYIGSHTRVDLFNAGYAVTVFDNCCNSKFEALNRVERISGKVLSHVHGNVRDGAALHDSGATALIHVAGLKAVGESGQIPLDYYENKVAGRLQLLQSMQACGVKTLLFSPSTRMVAPNC